jgi:hypothetical protein
MSTQAQIAANQANAELSTGPKTEEGKAVSSRNHTSHGLTYKGVAFFLLPWENAEEYDWLVIDLKSEYRPKSATETILVERMAQHHWLRNRAELLQTHCFDDAGGLDEKRLALFLRYQTTHERAFHRCLNDLLKLRAEKRKLEIGFESQNQKQEKHQMAKERHKWGVLLAEAKVDHRQMTQTAPAIVSALAPTQALSED